MRKPTIESWVAAHRFGLGEPDLAALAGDPRGWLQAQVGAADPHRGQGLPSSHEGVVRLARQQRESQLAQAERAARAASAAMSEAAAMSAPAADPLRRIVVEDIRARMVTAATTKRPFAERLALFWTNHFAVSVGKGSVRTLAGAFQREAIRPHIAGPFETLLRAAVTHAAMLRFLDNEASAGPRSRVVQAERRRADAGAGRRPRVQGAEREPGARGAGAAHAGRAGRGGGQRRRRRGLHAGRRDRARRAADRLARAGAGAVARSRRPGNGLAVAGALRRGLARTRPQAGAGGASTAKANRPFIRSWASWRATRRRRTTSPGSWRVTSLPIRHRRRWCSGWRRAFATAKATWPASAGP
jgi:hypothetical protein